jgi:hypothetical protein
MLALAALSIFVLSGCGSEPNPAGPLTKHLLRGVAQIRETTDKKKLHAQLAETVRSLRRDRSSKPTVRKARALAVQGFSATLKGVESELDFIENDRGNIEAATRDATRADRFRRRGATLLRAAGRVLGLRIGDLNGY